MSSLVSRVYVWPVILRVAHWVIALATLMLLLTGGLLKSGLMLSETSFRFVRDDLHLPAGLVLALALAFRVYLLLRDKGVSGVSALLPSGSSWQGIKVGLRFYTAFTRAPLPRYYAHHPVWAPIYLLWFGLLLFEVGTGLLLEFAVLRGSFGLSSLQLLEWHAAPFTLMTMLVALHLLSVVLHDLKGQGSDVSAIINGHRTFAVDEARQAVQSRASLSLGELHRRRPPHGRDEG